MIALSANARRVLQARYLRRDSTGKIIEAPEELFARVARAIAEAETHFDGGPQAAAVWKGTFYDMLTNLEFLPNSPTLMNAGTPLGQLSACFVLPVPDTIEGIFESVKQMALIQRSGGGTGFSFSRLRPREDFVASTCGRSSGPVSFMKIFDCATENIKQGGKRRGANMGVLRVDHPDIEEFVNCKLDGTAMQNFNLSVGVTDRFMQAARDDSTFQLGHPGTGKIVKEIRARALFDTIADAAWQCGDPGLLFLDAINRDNPTPDLGAIETTNPCGEIPLLPYEACNLGSINLTRMLADTAGVTTLDWNKLERTVTHAARFLDDVIEVNRYPTPEIARATRASRKIGLGVMGLAEFLIRLGISYDSDEAVQLSSRIMEFIATKARAASNRLADERGDFPEWKRSIFATRQIKMRNATCTAIAPTGTIGIIAGTSPSIEPLFGLAYQRTHVLGEQTLSELNSVFAEYLEQHALPSKTILQRIVKTGTLRDVPDLPAEVRRLFVTSLEISPERHLQIQAAFQRHVDNSVSKTINLPQQATSADVRHAYFRAWELGLKGVTVYRYSSRARQVLQLGTAEESYYYEHGSKCDSAECRV